MDLTRRCHFVRVMAFGLAACVWPACGWGQGEGAKPAPSGEAPAGEPRSRLTISGLYETDSYRQKNFFLGARAADSTATGYASDFDAYWTQRLTLRPRFILSDNLNINLNLNLAQGIWGLDNETSSQDQPGFTNLYNNKDTFFHFQVNWAYLAYRHASTGTRWYLGRQKFGLGNLLVLDEDAPGLQVYKDFPRWNSTLDVGFAKQWEGTNGLTDHNGLTHPDSLPDTGPDGRDADLFYAQWRTENKSGSFLLNPFLAYYLDRSGAAGTTYLPNAQGYPDARYRPNISRATVMGLAGRLQGGVIHLEFEVDKLSGKDGVKNADSGPGAVLDVNDGTLTGFNLLGRLTLVKPSFEIGGTVGLGSGDDNLFGEGGNFNYLRNQGHFSLTEVWGNGLALDELGLAPQGLGNPFVRGYRGLENSRIFQGHLAIHLRDNLRLSGSYSMIRAAKDLRPWTVNSQGVVTASGYGHDSAGKGGLDRALGTEIDGRIDWTIERKVTLTLRGGLFSPGPAAGFLINGTAKYQEKASQIRLGVSAPIPEFSLGG